MFYKLIGVLLLLIVVTVAFWMLLYGPRISHYE
jgi:hypothetical protein